MNRKVKHSKIIRKILKTLKNKISKEYFLSVMTSMNSKS